MTELTYKVGLFCPVMPATLKNGESNCNVVFYCWTVAKAVFDSLWFILYCGSRVLPRNILYICFHHCHASGKERKKGKIPMLETNLSKNSWEIVHLERCWVKCINGFPNYSSVRRLLDSSADVNISASSSPPSCQQCHLIHFYFQRDKLHVSFTTVLW